MAYFQTNNHTLGKFWRVLQWKVLVNFMAGLFYGNLVYFVVIGYMLWSFGIFPALFGMLYQEKSCNPARDHSVSAEQ
jgi:hypothetical protein